MKIKYWKKQKSSRMILLVTSTEQVVYCNLLYVAGKNTLLVSREGVSIQLWLSKNSIYFQ